MSSIEIEENDPILIQDLITKPESYINYSSLKDEFTYNGLEKHSIISQKEVNRDFNYDEIIPPISLNLPENTNILINEETLTRTQELISNYASSNDFDLNFFANFPLFKYMLTTIKLQLILGKYSPMFIVVLINIVILSIDLYYIIMSTAHNKHFLHK